MRKLLTYLVCSICLPGIGLSAQEASTNFSNPTKRFIRQNPNKDTLSYWGEDIALEIVGPAVDEGSFQISAFAKTLASNAGVNLHMIGKPQSWFSPKKTPSEEANFLIVLENNVDPSLREKKSISAGDINLKFNRLDGSVGEIFERGLPRRGPGCFGDWAANSNNEISAFVLVAFPIDDPEIKNACYKTLLPAAFGVFPAVTTLDFSYAPRFEGDGIFYDDSEVYQLLRAAAFCRNELLEKHLACVTGVLGHLYATQVESLGK